MKRLKKLHETLKNRPEYNICNFYDYVFKTLNTLTKSGGIKSQSFNKLYEALAPILNREFKSAIVIRRSALNQTSTGIYIVDFLIKSCEERHCMMRFKTSVTKDNHNE